LEGIEEGVHHVARTRTRSSVPKYCQSIDAQFQYTTSRPRCSFPTHISATSSHAFPYNINAPNQHSSSRTSSYLSACLSTASNIRLVPPSHAHYRGFDPNSGVAIVILPDIQTWNSRFEKARFAIQEQDIGRYLQFGRGNDFRCVAMKPKYAWRNRRERVHERSASWGVVWCGVVWCGENSVQLNRVATAPVPSSLAAARLKSN